MTNRVVILASGGGSNAQVLMDAAQLSSGLSRAPARDCPTVVENQPPFEIVAVVSNHADALVLQRAAAMGVRTEVLEAQPGEPRDRYDNRLARVLTPYRPDLVVLAGWMRILTGEFCAGFPIINLHPAAPGQFPGANAISDAWAAFQVGDITETGVMVHWVPDAGVDTGPVLRTESVPIFSTDTLDSLTERIHAVEHRLLPQALCDALLSLPADRTPEPMEVSP